MQLQFNIVSCRVEGGKAYVFITVALLYYKHSVQTHNHGVY